MDTSERRSPLLIFFTFVANAYLVLFLSDAVLSLGDELWHAATGASPLTALRNQLALLVVLSSLVMVFVVAFVPPLPKIVFLPLIAAALWLAVGAPPFVALGDHKVSLFLSLCQLIIAAAAFLAVQLKAGRSLLSAELLPHRSHLFLRIAFASLVIVALVPVGLIGFGAWAVASATHESTKGYIQFTWSEVQARETVLRNGNKTVRLIATAHIAERSFYEAIYRSIPPHAVILAEGIGDEKGLLAADDSSRGEAASFLGLQTQDVLETLMAPEVAGDNPNSAPPVAGNKPEVVRADIDVAELSPATLRCLREDVALGDAALDAKDAPKATPACSEADRKLFWDEILYTRNNHLLKEFDKQLANYDVFIVPWGAMHMPDLELAFKERGFKVEASRLLTLARYQTVAGHVFGGLSAYKLRGAANRPYALKAR